MEQLKYLDETVLVFINHLNTPFLDYFFWFISNSLILLPLYLTWVYLLFKHFKLKTTIIIICIILAIAFNDISTNQIKKGVKRLRPSHQTEVKSKLHIVNEYRGGAYGFFSAHASNAFCVATILILCFKLKQKKFLFLSQFFIVAFFIAFSRVYLGVHFPSDVTVGGIYGTIIGLVFYKFFLQQIDG